MVIETGGTVGWYLKWLNCKVHQTVKHVHRLW